MERNPCIFRRFSQANLVSADVYTFAVHIEKMNKQNSRQLSNLK